MRPAVPDTFEAAGGIGGFLRDLVADAWHAVRQWSWPRKAAVACGCLLFAAIALWADVPPLSTLREWAQGLGGWFPLAYWAAYVLVTQFPVPRTVLTLSAGILFGPAVGIAIALTATVVSAVVSLLVVRHFLGAWMAPRLRHPAVSSITHRLEQRGWLAVGSLRMIAGVPFCVLNYACALSPVAVAPFAVATFVGSAPGSIATVLLGDTLTGHANPAIIAVTVVLALLGVSGLVLEHSLPIKPGSTESGRE